MTKTFPNMLICLQPYRQTLMAVGLGINYAAPGFAGTAFSKQTYMLGRY